MRRTRERRCLCAGGLLVLLLLTSVGIVCGRARWQARAKPVYRTEVTLSSLDCDVVMWRYIMFHDETGAIIATASSGPPLGDATPGCTVRFRVDLPQARSYVLDNGTRRSAPFSFDELKARHFSVDVRLR